MLEMNGLRYRLVGGFNPTNRIWYPGGGHTAIEVWDGAQWNYVDPYFDLLLEKLSAHKFKEAENARVKCWELLRLPESQLTTERKLAMKNLTLADLFKYYIYGDKLMRLPMAHRVQLVAAAARGQAEVCLSPENYGLQWPLRPGFEELNVPIDFPETQTIYVRARLLVGDIETQPLGSSLSSLEAKATFGPWKTTSFQCTPMAYARSLGLAP
jgi:hypothetical protein